MYGQANLGESCQVESDPVSMDTSRGEGMKNVPVDGVSILGGLNLEKIQGLRTRKTVLDNEVSY